MNNPKTARFYIEKKTFIRELNHILIAISLATDESVIELACDCFTSIDFCVNLVDSLDKESFCNVTINVLDCSGDVVHSNRVYEDKE